MRTIFFALSLALLILCAAAGIIVGAGIMIYDLYSHGPNFTHGFHIFSLSSILFLAAITSFMVTKVLTNTEVIADVLAKFMAHEMKKELSSGGNPLHQLFQNLGMGGGGFPGMPGMSGSIKMSTIDENGNITPLGEKEFSSPEEFIKYRNEILQKAFGKKGPTKKPFEEMTITELEAEEQKAIDAQEFELAAAVRDLIKEKKKGAA